MPDWDGSWSEAQRLVGLYSAMYAECTARRDLLQKCIDNLKQQKVVK